VTQGDAQELFVELEAKWVPWVLSHPGWRLRHGEGRILAKGADEDKQGRPLGRRAVLLGTETVVRVEDRVHMAGGAHYLGTGADWQLFVDGTWISDGDHPAWVACGEKWESLHPLARRGGRFKKSDANHCSILFEGKS